MLIPHNSEMDHKTAARRQTTEHKTKKIKGCCTETCSYEWVNLVKEDDNFSLWPTVYYKQATGAVIKN